MPSAELREKVSELESDLDQEASYTVTLDQFQEELRIHARTESDENLMHCLHQVILIRNLCNQAFRDELEQNVQDAIRDSNDTIEGDEETPVPMSQEVLARIVPKIDLADAIDFECGYVKEPKIASSVVEAFGTNSNDVSYESIHPHIELLAGVLQSEFIDLNSKYQDNLSNLLSNISEELEEDSSYSNILGILMSFNTSIHHQYHGWPDHDTDNN